MRSLFLFLLFSLPIINSLAQQQVLDHRFSFHSDSIGFSKLLDTLSKDLDVSFSYDATIIRGDSVLSVHVDAMKLGEWLRMVLPDDEVQLFQMGRQIVIAREPARLPVRSIHLSGSVKDGATNVPLVMVNIGVEGETIGTITNSEGSFGLKVPPVFAGRTLCFSTLGYFKSMVDIPAHDTTMIISLKEKVIRLPEVLVKYVNPAVVMRKVLQMRDRNYPSEPTVLTAFFRETIKQDGRYVDVSEAVLEVYKPSYLSESASERVRFVKGRKGGETVGMDVINFKLQGGPLLFSQVDIIRQGSFLPDENGHSNYQYTYNGLDYEQGRNIYIIGFKPVHDTGELLYQGEMHIDQASFALVGARFEMSRNTLRKSREYLIRRDSRRFRTRPYFARYTIDYRPVAGLWMLNSVRGEVSLKIIDRQRRVRTVFNTISEMMVTNLRSAKGQKLKWSDSFKFNDILSEEIDSYDSAFWSRYNIIRPDESIRRVFISE